MAEREPAVAPGPVAAAPSARFWSGRKVLLTGHTGFKGAWLAAWLHELGAEVHGLALAPETEPSLFRALAERIGIRSTIGDIRDPALVTDTVATAAPEIVIHLAAQALVRRSYRDAAGTFATNVQGTVNLLEALRGRDGVRVTLVVTSDKVYENLGTGVPLHESDALGGADPYSASKAAVEIVTSSYARSFLAGQDTRVATARAGNVIGGGDWSDDRVVPDIWRAFRSRAPIGLRYPDATRPWQHVLDPLAGYLCFVERLWDDASGALPRALNFGPDNAAHLTVAELVGRFTAAYGEGPGWVQSPGPHPPEAALLAIDARLARQSLGWWPRLATEQAVAWTAEWYRGFDRGADPAELTLAQIRRFQDLP